MLETLLNRPCLIHRTSPSSTTDQFGSPTDTVTAVATVCELQALAAARGDGEPSQHLDLSDSGWLLILPAGTEIDPPDTVEVEGLIYEVVTAPWSVRSPWTRVHSHIEVGLRRTA